MENPRERGDLIIRFKIVFPTSLPDASKNYIKKAFRVSSAAGDRGDADFIQRIILDDKLRRNIDTNNIPIHREIMGDEDNQWKAIC